MRTMWGAVAAGVAAGTQVVYVMADAIDVLIVVDPGACRTTLCALSAGCRVRSYCVIALRAGRARGA